MISPVIFSYQDLFQKWKPCSFHLFDGRGKQYMYRKALSFNVATRKRERHNPDGTTRERERAEELSPSTTCREPTAEELIVTKPLTLVAAPSVVSSPWVLAMISDEIHGVGGVLHPTKLRCQIWEASYMYIHFQEYRIRGIRLP